MSETENTAAAVATADDEGQFGGTAAEAALGVAAVYSSGELDPSLLAGVPKPNETIPKGTRAVFNLRSWKKGESEPWKATTKNPAGRPELEKYGKQPYYNVEFVCQQEPHTGRRIYEFIHFVNDTTQAAAIAGDAVAAKVVKDRLIALADLLRGTGYQPTAKFSIENFFNTKPNTGIVVGSREDNTGKQRNSVIEFYFDPTATRR